MKNINHKIIIGTAQFSDNYGLSKNISNIKEKKILLDRIAHHNCYGIDTALDYGNAQKIIGSWLQNNSNELKIYTKISGIGDFKELDKMFLKCMKELNIEKCQALLIHNQKNWKNKTVQLFTNNLLSANIVKQIGVSIYDYELVPSNSEASIVQIPGSIFNQKVLNSKNLKKFVKNGGEVHVRSIFIQGLLLLSPKNLPKYFQAVKEPLEEFNDMCIEYNVNPISISTNCILKLFPQCKLVIGVDSISQLDDIIKKINIQIDDNIVYKFLEIGKKYSNNFWDPRNWKIK